MEDRILVAYFKAYIKNIAFKIDNYYRITYNYSIKIHISNSSFITNNLPGTIVYNELFIINNNPNLNIVSSLDTFITRYKQARDSYLEQLENKKG